MDVRVPDPAPSKIRWVSSLSSGGDHAGSSGSPRRASARRFAEGDACSPYLRVLPPVTSGASASPRSTHATTHRKTRTCHRRRGVRARRRSAGPLPQAAAVATAAPTATAADGDLCQGRCADILPPGQNGNATLADILVHKVLGTRPAHSSDQLGRYDSLVGGYGGLTDAKLNDFFNDSSFGVPDGQAESVTTPAPTSPSPGTRRPASPTSRAPPATEPSSAPDSPRAKTACG